MLKIALNCMILYQNIKLWAPKPKTIKCWPFSAKKSNIMQKSAFIDIIEKKIIINLWLVLSSRDNTLFSKIIQLH